eukprot:355369-Chlamydomonas_euryale.AAC.9
MHLSVYRTQAVAMLSLHGVSMVSTPLLKLLCFCKPLLNARKLLGRRWARNARLENSPACRHHQRRHRVRLGEQVQVVEMYVPEVLGTVRDDETHRVEVRPVRCDRQHWHPSAVWWPQSASPLSAVLGRSQWARQRRSDVGEGEVAAEVVLLAATARD